MIINGQLVLTDCLSAAAYLPPAASLVTVFSSDNKLFTKQHTGSVSPLCEVTSAQVSEVSGNLMAYTDAVSASLSTAISLISGGSGGVTIGEVETAIQNSNDGLTDIQIFTSDGNWYPPSGSGWKEVEIFAMGGGQGGSSGRTTPATASSAGGNGGAGGKIVRLNVPFTDISASINPAVGYLGVWVGAGGAGGIANGTTSLIGGGGGGNTQFGTGEFMIIAEPGGVGPAAGGQYLGANPGTGSAGNNGGAGGISVNAGSGGGGGGIGTGSPGSAKNGGPGGQTTWRGRTNPQVGCTAEGVIPSPSSTGTWIGPGNGGGGGASSISGVGLHCHGQSCGKNYGSGGGGGGSVRSGNAGNGGAGRQGICVVTTRK